MHLGGYLKRGFSLVEVLFALVVISCIVAAFTPLLTKKFSSNVLNNMEITTDCTDKFGENCTLCTSTYCIDCTSLSCPDGEYRDSKSCTCKKCSDTYGPDCTKCNDKKCLTCPDGQYLDDKNKCIDCSAKFSNCAKCTMNECTACDDGYALTDPVSNTPCSKFDCSGPDFIQIGELCITKKNMGDGDSLIIPSGVNVVNAGNKCDANVTDKCCWKGNTSGTDCDNENGGAYSGCNRTVCDWRAADYICNNFTAGGYTWRLPTVSELMNWATLSKGKGIIGLQLCDNYSGYSSARCSNLFNCPGASNSWCYPCYVWSSSISPTTYFYYFYLHGGSWYQDNMYFTIPFSTRCVAQMPQSCADKFNEGCTICEGSQCLECSSGYILKDGKCELDCSKFGSNCSSCTTSKCTACADGYKLSSNPSGNPACVSDFSCDGDDFIQIGSLCITKKNMGDGDKLAIPSGVKVVNTSQTCNPSGSNKCCWKGKTASSCNNDNGGGYSGCTRTVCDWYAADYICKNFKAGGYTWRLVTTSEMSNWANNSKGKGVNGLQLCDNLSGYSSARCDGTSSCPGSSENWCYPNHVWSGTVNGSSFAYGYDLGSGGWYQNNYYARTLAFSVRCVAQMPQSCSDKYGAGCATCTDSKCLSCESGYDLSSNASSSNACEKQFSCSGTDFMQIGSLCVTRRNMGDSTTLTIPSGVNVVNTGQTCNPSSSNKCCWKGTTASSCNNDNGGGYSGCKRTVCDWYAADYICKNFKAGGYTWRLATTSEMSNWANNSKGKGVNGLQLCNSYSGYSSAQCYDTRSCPGSSGYCYPYYVWSGTANGSSYAYYYYLTRGDWRQSYNGRTNPQSVRCVTKL